MLYISHVIYFIWLISLEITRYTICYSSPVFVGTHLWAVWRAPRGRPPVATSRTPGSPSRVAYGGSCHGKGGKSMGNLWEIDDFWEIYGLSLGNLWEIDDFLGNLWFIFGKTMICLWEIYRKSMIFWDFPRQGLVGGWALPLWKMMERKSVGMMKFSIYRKIIHMFETTSQRSD